MVTQGGDEISAQVYFDRARRWLIVDLDVREAVLAASGFLGLTNYSRPADTSKHRPSE